MTERASTMNVHTARPACYLADREPEPRGHAFRDRGMWCYMRPDEAARMTPGCTGCRRFQAEIKAGGLA